MKILDYDVVVCGAGVAGVAAATAAARQGARTAVIEKQCVLGGLATSGLIYIFLPLCNGKGTQITRGLADEMFRRSPRYSPFTIPAAWENPADGSPPQNARCCCCFSPAGFSLTLDEMLSEAGGDLWLDTRITGVAVDENRISTVQVVNDSGFNTLRAKCFVDATGRAAVAAMAGAKVVSEKNYVTPWILEMAEDPSFFHFSGPLHIRPFGKTTPEYEVAPGYGGREITDFCRREWAMIREYYRSLSPEEALKNYPVHLPGMPQLRKIGRIEALYTLSDADHGRHFDTSVGVAADWNRPDPGWEIPYEALIPKDLKGLLTAGRCIGATGYAWEICRVIPAAALSGEAAGTAAALSVAANITPEELSVKVLRDELEKKGARFEMASC